jgi:hypothetical protein
MKNIKMVLTAVAIFAVVGGALAFKTKPFFNTSFCASQTQNSGCAVITGKKVGTAATNFFIDPAYNGGTCSSTVCGTATNLIND